MIPRFDAIGILNASRPDGFWRREPGRGGGVHRIGGCAASSRRACDRFAISKLLIPLEEIADPLCGWELAILPDERIVYHHSQIHFAPTHWLEVSVFDPTTLKEKQIYPPKPYQPVRTI
jgi:hypothetical protein